MQPKVPLAPAAIESDDDDDDERSEAQLNDVNNLICTVFS